MEIYNENYDYQKVLSALTNAFVEGGISKEQLETTIATLGFDLTIDYKDLSDDELRDLIADIKNDRKERLDDEFAEVRKQKYFKTMLQFDQYPGIMGAAIGDVWGSYYEFRTDEKTPKLMVSLHQSSTYTDHTVLPAAIADYLTRKSKGEDVKPERVIKEWCAKYPSAGYGARFSDWLDSQNPKPYGSYGNGSAMRVSPVAYFAKSEEECDALAEEVTSITHNHPEGIKGAKVIARCIYMALHGKSKTEIEAYARQYYNLDIDVHGMFAYMGHGDEICQITVPQAIWAFLHSDSFEDCLRLAISIRWDADTLAAIACSIAEAYYKEIPEDIYSSTIERMDEPLIAALQINK